MHRINFFGSLLLLLTSCCHVYSQHYNTDYQALRTTQSPARPQANVYASQPQSAYSVNQPSNDWTSTRQVSNFETNQATVPQQNVEIGGRFAPQPTNPTAEAVAKGNENFSLSVFKTLVDSIPAHDFIASPFSIYSLLATLTEGATNPSETLNELLTVLNIRPEILSRLSDIYSEILQRLLIKTDTIELSLYQGIFNNYTYPLNAQFRNTVQQKYKTNCEEIEGGKSVDDVLKRINSIVNQATNGNLKAAFSKRELQGAVMLLLSVIHFKGQWAYPFNRTYTKSEPFFDEFGNSAGNVQMMFERSPVAFAPIKELESHVLQLPYGQQNRLSMVVILPRKNVTLSQVAEKLLNYNLNDMFTILKKSLQDYEDEEIEIHLPKFTINSDLALNHMLQRMGLSTIFSSDAQLNKMNPDIFLSKLVHKAKIEVDEEGTVASAVTGGVFANKSSAPRFYANRPFLYMIVDSATQLVLFCGQMRNNPYTRS